MAEIQYEIQSAMESLRDQFIRAVDEMGNTVSEFSSGAAGGLTLAGDYFSQFMSLADKVGGEFGFGALSKNIPFLDSILTNIGINAETTDEKILEFKNNIFETLHIPEAENLLTGAIGITEEIASFAAEFSKSPDKLGMVLSKLQNYSESGNPGSEYIAEALAVKDEFLNKASQLSVLGKALWSGVEEFDLSNMDLSKINFDKIENILTEYAASGYAGANQISQILDFTDSVKTKIGDVKNFGEAIRSTFADFSIDSSVSELREKLQNTFGEQLQHFDPLKEQLTGIFDIGQNSWDFVKQIFDGDALSGIFNKVKNGGSIIDLGKDLFNHATGAEGTGAFFSSLSSLPDLFNGIKETITGGNLLEMAKNALSGFSGSAGGIIGSFADSILGPDSAIGKTKIGGFFSGAFDLRKTKASGMFSSVFGITETDSSSIKPFDFSRVIDEAKKAFTGEDHFETIKNILSGFSGSAGSVIASLTGSVAGHGNTTGNKKIGGFLNGVFNSLKDKAAGLFGIQTKKRTGLSDFHGSSVITRDETESSFHGTSNFKTDEIPIAQDEISISNTTGSAVISEDILSDTVVPPALAEEISVLPSIPSGNFIPESEGKAEILTKIIISDERITASQSIAENTMTARFNTGSTAEARRLAL
ncbi:hypothetical protein [Breznakiella homolactica]|uniref:Uncharacterized protein n=1 Tax=Breznakiella homolactica TaxID=2798577 RepID=A0A7T7XPV1_9SPIR|nr:hypothetical protein [Breznakiella homolactica]QQO10319.1 hypothetical protein JFL75_05205 [Breznakiella homolactica]